MVPSGFKDLRFEDLPQSSNCKPKSDKQSLVEHGRSVHGKRVQMTSNCFEIFRENVLGVILGL